MSDEVKEQTQEQVPRQEAALQKDEPVEVQKPGPITTESGVDDRIIKVLENQQLIINKLSEAYNNSSTTINSLMQKISTMEDKLVNHEKFLPEVVGDFNFNEKFSDLGVKELEKMEKENRALFDSIISRYRV